MKSARIEIAYYNLKVLGVKIYLGYRILRLTWCYNRI